MAVRMDSKIQDLTPKKKGGPKTALTNESFFF
jgi:hypothetical protein